MSLVALAIALAFFIPFLWMVSASVRPSDEIFASLSPLSVNILLPNSFSLDSYARLLDGPLARSVVNLLIMTVGALLPGLLMGSVAAFAFAVMRLPFRNALFAVVVVSFMIPFDLIAVPLSGLFRSWGLANTYPALILPGIANGLAIFLMRQFFLGIPLELTEAAIIDGARWWTIYWRIYLPLSKPALISAGMLIFLTQWSSYFWPLLIVNQDDMNVAPVVLNQFMSALTRQIDYGPMFAGAALISLVPAVVLLLAQPYFAQSVSRSGIR